MNTSL